ncbi:hypothetical protein JJJ17_13990 [Paracoccus caeni]|uniref:Uncharacterized protein n=1 Tax=Paracoccus caeni TaxID=657651 RepID=A0A934SDU3_9RHOB|nr:hypothetical protein [Paracoccus caeni]MBK4217040.1 hypothetical protein [Paracoccus caeni]
MQNNESLVVPFFKTVAVENPIASKRQGRPIFKDVEMVEIRIAGDRNFAPTFPAKSMWKRVDGEELSYADRWPEAYGRFKQGQEQVAQGTPLSELPFLTEARRQELRMLKVYTAEALASLDGKNLTNLGPQGREMKDQATAYLERAGGLAMDIALREELADLRAKLAEMQAEKKPEPDQDERESLKAQIAEKTGARPRGNPSVDTLRDMLADLEA